MRPVSTSINSSESKKIYFWGWVWRYRWAVIDWVTNNRKYQRNYGIIHRCWSYRFDWDYQWLLHLWMQVRDRWFEKACVVWGQVVQSYLSLDVSCVWQVALLIEFLLYSSAWISSASCQRITLRPSSAAIEEKFHASFSKIILFCTIH